MRTLAPLLLFLATATLHAADKSAYNLFNPTPREQMRDLNTDRPNQTESPFTVDAGHFQLEMALANYTQDRSGGVLTRTWNIAPFSFRLGLVDNADLQFIFDSYLHQHIEDRPSHISQTASGIGDLTLRLKVNLWGNNGGPTAFGIIPFIKIPTNTAGLGNDAIEGGISFPLDISLPSQWDLGLMTECDFLRNEANNDYHTEFLNSATLGHTLLGALSGYVEIFTDISSESGSRLVATADLGLTYALTKDIQLDTGCNFGLTRSSNDFNPFIGISARF